MTNWKESSFKKKTSEKMTNWKEKILAYALKNGIEHDGKAQANAVLNSLFHEGLERGQIKGIMPDIQDAVKQVNSISLQEQEEKFRQLEDEVDRREAREGLPEIPGTEKGVVARFSPSPSGPLHIGHILTIGPNFLYVKKYGGKFYVRIEDTNPENIYKPAYKMIEQEAKWLCKGKVKIIIQSARMKLYYKYAEDLIKKKAAYVCDCDNEKFKKILLARKPCPCRGISAGESPERWKKMLDKGRKGYKEGEAVLRFKSDLNDPNPAMRDFPLARINETKHPLQGKKFRVWPLMNLAVAVDDIEMKVTHIIRGKDHKDNAKRQAMIFKVFNKKYPWHAFIGRLHFKDLVLSTTQMRKDIENGKYSGWDDERLPTAASLKKKKYKPEAFWRFCEQRGINEVDKIISREEFFKILDNFNK